MEEPSPSGARARIEPREVLCASSVRPSVARSEVVRARRRRVRAGAPAQRIAVDACSPWTFEALCGDTDWTRFEASLFEAAERRRAGVISALILDVTAQLDNFHELASIVSLGEVLGCDGVRFEALRAKKRSGDGARRSVISADHPLHMSLLETLRDPVFERASCELGALEALRKKAFSTRLPSDEEALTSGARCVDRCQSMLAAGDPARCCALSAHGRWRFPECGDLMILEAAALESLGFVAQAAYRYREHLRARPGDSQVMVALGVALMESGQTRRGVRALISAATATREPAMHEMLARYLARLIEAPRSS